MTVNHHLQFHPISSNIEDIDYSLSTREEILALLPENLVKAQQQMKTQADSPSYSYEFLVGDWVYLKLQFFCQQSIAQRKYHSYLDFIVSHLEYYKDKLSCLQT